MDPVEFHSLMTLASLFGFLSIAAWAFSRERTADFRDAACLPFTEPEERARQSREALARALGCPPR